METILMEDAISKKAKKIILNIAIFFFLAGIIFLVVNILYYNDKSNIVTNRDGSRNYADIIRATLEAFVFWFAALIFLFIRWSVSKMQITITNKRVCGKTYFGRSVDLPMDSISAVGASWLKGIAVSTSSGKVSFLLMEHSKEIYELLRQLLIDRQEQKWKSQNGGLATDKADELKKYKELLDEGVITQEEFEAKKKQLLNL